jgi:ABC-type sugar transport system ATPase subunit
MPQQQLVEIARALGRSARILILDEPTASLSERRSETSFEFCVNSADRGSRSSVFHIESKRSSRLPIG